MKYILIFISSLLMMNMIVSCRSAKKLQKAVNKKDTAIVAQKPQPVSDTAAALETLIRNLKKNHIDFETFSAKIKVDYSDSRGKQPDVNAFIRIKKDSVIWVSINATFLNFEAFRILITKDSIRILNKLNKQYESHSLDYLEQIAKIPLDFKTLQDILIGNPVFLGDSIVAHRETQNRILISTIDKHFKNLLTLTAGNYLMERSKLDDINVALNRTADLTYFNYENKPGFYFSTVREITVAEKTKVDILLNFKQYDFNKEVTFPFIIPKNYKPK